MSPYFRATILLLASLHAWDLRLPLILTTIMVAMEDTVAMEDMVALMEDMEATGPTEDIGAMDTALQHFHVTATGKNSCKINLRAAGLLL